MAPSTMLRHAAADSELRDAMLSAPETFGVSAEALPASVEQQDADSLAFWTEGVAAMDVYACSSTCSFGPFTIVCDGTTKG
jgi:hypothetical protein